MDYYGIAVEELNADLCEEEKLTESKKNFFQENSEKILQICNYLLHHFEDKKLPNTTKGMGISSSLKMPIESIDELPVNVVLRTSRRPRCNISISSEYYMNYETYLIIESNKIVNSNFEYEDSSFVTYYSILLHSLNSTKEMIDINYFINVIIKFKSVLKEIYFNKFFGKFYCKKMDKINFNLIGEEFKGLFDEINNSNIKLHFEECCVCNELTMIKTPCNHYLCYPCWEQIKCRCSSADELPCPICRSKCL
jgi:hypothetical protein